jgi:hypothetical protein
MAKKPRPPISEAERQEMRDRFQAGESFLEISKVFYCSTRSVENACVGLRSKYNAPKPQITNKQIAEIAQLRKEKVHIAQISRIVGVSVTSVTRYSPRELKGVGSTMGGNSSVVRRREERQRMVMEVLAASENIPKPKPMPRPVDELPDSVQRMIKSLRDQGHKEDMARSWAIAYYNKNRKP